MAEQKLLLRDFSGGIASIGEKKDKPFSARFVKNLDPFESPDYITLSKAPTKVSGSTVTDLIFWAEDGSPYDTNFYFYDLSGKIYRETSGGTWSSLRTVSGGAGEGLKVFDDFAYYALDIELGRYGKLSGTPAFDDALTSWWSAAISDIQTTGGGVGATAYSLTTGINEGATHIQTFSVTHDPIKSITVDVVLRGTGDWTLTVHDAQNKTIGSATVTNANLADGVDETFTFTTALRVVIGNDYHFHLTSTVADGTADTSTNNDLEAAEFTVEYGVLISGEFHPMVAVEDKLIIGNDQYLAVFDQATYDPNKILLDVGFKVRSITKVNEYVVANCYKGATVDEAEESRNFYWDTIAPSWNFYSDTTSIGAGNALTNTGNRLRGIYGNRGGLYEGDAPAEKLIDNAPKLTKGKVLNVFPGAIADKDGITLIGISGSTDDSTGLEQGVYAYGSKTNQLGDALVLLHPISTGTTQGTTLKIGMIKVLGDDIYYSWRDSSTYGVDKVSPDSLAATSGVYESLIFDEGDTDKAKLAVDQVTTFEALESGETVVNKSKFDRATSFTTGNTASAVGSLRVKNLHVKRFKEIEVGFTVTSSGGTFPKITQHQLTFNDLADEESND